MIDVVDLPADQLAKSKTWRQYYDADGICSRCKEHTSVLYSCCNANVYFEGGELNSNDLWNEIEDELKEYAKGHYEHETT